ncbi:DNA-directed RNA polymerase subunit L [archaeon]|jgi:DNA-directed RNA polymerase subunit L|nr:DNA-directed RNA polymerase subunit L [archaeon]MBT6824192.1 DNA-directed RNA polymerase subunit L [archaeon]MBT7106964.1 DNA-directed RNA polymerase subunit L [archaeon]MBT7297576.1 DNA-directed RNA polymerase subunit L [archaeon]
MEIKILESEKNKIKIELIGEDHTLANIIRKELWNDSHIKVSGYDVKHPQIGSPILIVETDGKEDPKKALLAAVERIQKNNNDLLDQLKIKK